MRQPLSSPPLAAQTAATLTAVTLTAAALVGCAEGSGAGGRSATEPPLPEPVNPGGARLWFSDVAEPAGLGGFLQVNGDPAKPYIVDQMGAGVALLDHDVDGDLDVYLTNGSDLDGFPPGEEPRDALYANRGDGTFDEVTDAAGLGDTLWTNGVTVADVNADGYPDLYLTNFGPNVLYLGDGRGAFVDRTEASGLGDPQWSTGAAFFDADLDGDLDVYVAGYVDFDRDFVPSDRQLCQYRGVMVAYGPRGLGVAPDHYYRNRGDGVFEERTEEAGMRGPAGYGFQTVAFDYDQDGDTDLFVGNDSVANFLWQNDGSGFFVDVAQRSGTAVSQVGLAQACMGAAVGDYNGDALPDLFVTNFAEDYHTLYRNDGGGFFTDVTTRVGLRSATLPRLGWSCGFVDFDNDGDEDLFAVNGHLYPQVDQFDFGTSYRQLDQVFENVGDGTFRDVTAEAGPGLAVPRIGRGGAFGDVDGDGDVDVLVGNIEDRPALLRNDGQGLGEWLALRLVGTKCNRDAIGATVELVAGGRAQVRAVAAGGGFLSASDPRLHFGLGEARAAEVTVRWPGGVPESFGPLAAGRTHELHQGSGRPAGAAR